MAVVLDEPRTMVTGWASVYTLGSLGLVWRVCGFGLLEGGFGFIIRSESRGESAGA